MLLVVRSKIAYDSHKGNIYNVSAQIKHSSTIKLKKNTFKSEKKEKLNDIWSIPIHEAKKVQIFMFWS